MDAPGQALHSFLRQAFDGPSWHGPCLLGSLRGVTAAQAAWRPRPRRHDIWELVAHAAYWKYRVRRLLSERPPRSFDRPGSDWFVLPDDPTEAAWTDEKERLRRWHRLLLEAVAELDAAALAERPGKSRHTRWEIVAGAAAHDLYHAGQIQLLKRLMSGR